MEFKGCVFPISDNFIGFLFQILLLRIFGFLNFSSLKFDSFL